MKYVPNIVRLPDDVRVDYETIGSDVRKGRHAAVVEKKMISVIYQIVIK